MDTKNCESCGSPFGRNGRHGKRWERSRFCSHNCHGISLVKNRTSAFLEKVIPEPNSGCWLWEGATTRNGYGTFWDGLKLVKVHHFAFELYGGTVPVGKMVLHSCDLRCCVNPDHLRVGTHLDNMEDMRKRNRSLKGEKQSNSILKEQQVLDILSSGESPAALAQKHGVTRNAIYSIHAGNNWKHLQGKK